MTDRSDHRPARAPAGVRIIVHGYMESSINLSDEACEDALYDITSFREFCRIDLGEERVLDVNGKRMQTGDIGTMIFSVRKLIAYVS